MKKRRRIEITAFRRCTTIVLHDQSGVCPAGRPPGDGDLPSPIRTEQARAAENDLGQTQITNPDAAEQFGLRRDGHPKQGLSGDS